MPHKLCPKCSQSLETCVNLWSQAWDSQWLIMDREWTKDGDAFFDLTTSSVENTPQKRKNDSGIDISPTPEKNRLLERHNEKYWEGVKKNARGCYPCNQCPMTFMGKVDLKVHLQNHAQSKATTQRNLPKSFLGKELVRELYIFFDLFFFKRFL